MKNLLLSVVFFSAAFAQCSLDGRIASNSSRINDLRTSVKAGTLDVKAGTCSVKCCARCNKCKRA